MVMVAAQGSMTRIGCGTAGRLSRPQPCIAVPEFALNERRRAIQRDVDSTPVTELFLCRIQIVGDKSEAAAIALLKEQVSVGGRIGVLRDLD